ncbi:substrate-binding domain-containing protein [Nonomuraea sp. NPDC005983]|uniref:GntR family transcriptional regulator n=1 Tax=Nonomuraea sp. NPDC005983 TaxID=3155595 RepID=UPI0033B8DF21
MRAELKFQRLAAQIRAEIRSGHWPVGAKLPTEQELARIHDVSLTTVRRAVDELVDERLVLRRQGAGTFVVEHALAVPNQAALVGVIVPDTALYFPRVLEGIEETLTAAGARLMLACSRYEPSEEDSALERMLDSGVDGLLIVPTLIGRGDPAAEVGRLAALPVPVVLMERGLDEGDDPSEHVRTDHEAGGYAAVRHLAALGHTRLALLTRSGNPTQPPLVRGFTGAVAALGLAAAEPFAAPQGEWNPRIATDNIRRLAAEGVTAIVCFGDREATLMLSAARRHGLAVPGDLAIVAYDDEIADLAEVPLTAVSPPKRHLGRQAAELLLRRLREPNLPLHQVRLRPGIVVRRSCGASSGETTSD